MDRTYLVGKLSLKQIILLTRFITKTILASKEKLKKLGDNAQSNKTNTEDLLTIISLLEDKECYELFSILLNENDLTFLEKNLGLEDSTEIVAVICETNKFDRVKKNVFRIQKAFNLQKTD